MVEVVRRSRHESMIWNSVGNASTVTFYRSIVIGSLLLCGDHVALVKQGSLMHNGDTAGKTRLLYPSCFLVGKINTATFLS